MAIFGVSRAKRKLDQAHVVEMAQAREQARAQQEREQGQASERTAAAAAAFLASLPPASTQLEQAVERALDQVKASDADLARPTSIELARQFARPDEQILAVYHREGKGVSPRLTAVAFTKGFAVRTGGRSFRVERSNAGIVANADGRGTMDLTLGLPVRIHPDNMTERSFCFALKAQLDLAAKALGTARPQGNQPTESRPRTQLSSVSEVESVAPGAWRGPGQ